MAGETGDTSDAVAFAADACAPATKSLAMTLSTVPPKGDVVWPASLYACTVPAPRPVGRHRNVPRAVLASSGTPSTLKLPSNDPNELRLRMTAPPIGLQTTSVERVIPDTARKSKQP